jgi:serine/threonine protein kinase
MLGMSIGTYTIVAKIGQGGMGEVYRAVDHTLDRAAAVKVLLPSTANRTEMTSRLFNEARSAQSIRHPGIVEIYGFGMLPGPIPYIMMELLRGETLGELLRRTHGVSQAAALHIVRSVALALQVVHHHGIIHRDLKPGNIFAVAGADGQPGAQIKLLDFGIAKLGGFADDANRTQTGSLMGTPPYMSPEQCRGIGIVDHRADLYALGCILYELVCGRPPFITPRPGDLIAHHLYFEPELPRAHNRHVPPQLEALILWLLRKSPQDRPETAARVVAAIDELATTAMPAWAHPPPLRVASWSGTLTHQGTTAIGDDTAVVRSPCRRARRVSQGCRRRVRSR